MHSSHTHNDSYAVAVHDLRKSYGEAEAVRGVSFEVARGEVFCLLGPNGAPGAVRNHLSSVMQKLDARKSGRGGPGGGGAGLAVSLLLGPVKQSA